MRLAILTSHPIQYYSPLFRELAKRLDLTVFFAHNATPKNQARAGFGTPFEWDIDLVNGFEHVFLNNVSSHPDTDHFAGCDTPEFGKRLGVGDFDALLLTGWNLKSFSQGIAAANRHRIPILVRGDSQLGTPRSPLKRFGKEVFYPFFLRKFDAALYVGRRSKDYYRHYHYPEDRLFFSPHCVDTEWFAERSSFKIGQELREQHRIAADAKVILFAGKLLPFKRPLDLIPAIARLRIMGMDARLLVAGSGELKEAMQSDAKKLDVPLHMLGFLNQSEMPAAYAAADVLALPSDGHETWGLVCNEALACGTPIVVSDQAGCVPDLIASNYVGCTHNVKDTEDITKKLQLVLFDHTPNAADISRVSDLFDLKSSANGIEHALNFVVK